jgi:hypothetical protein
MFQRGTGKRESYKDKCLAENRFMYCRRVVSGSLLGFVVYTFEECAYHNVTAIASASTAEGAWERAYDYIISHDHQMESQDDD